MAKELPYFKFFVSEWSDGDITLEDFNTQGLFINLCSYYWSNECELTLTKAKKKFKICDKSCFDSIIEAGIIKVDDDVITINFLDEQQEERIEQSKTRSKGGKASAEARKRKKEQESNKNPTHVEHVLKSCSTETQLLREEKKREEKKKEEVYRFFDHLSISVIDYQKLLDLGWNKKQIDLTLDSIQNYSKNKNYKNLYLTSKKWLEKEPKASEVKNKFASPII